MTSTIHNANTVEANDFVPVETILQPPAILSKNATTSTPDQGVLTSSQSTVASTSTSSLSPFFILSHFLCFVLRVLVLVLVLGNYSTLVARR
jgi:hypothetical protein